jgi:hypothetical protein
VHGCIFTRPCKKNCVKNKQVRKSVFRSSVHGDDQADADDVWLNPNYAAPPLARLAPPHAATSKPNDTPQSDATNVDTSQDTLAHPTTAPSSAPAVAAGEGAGAAGSLHEPSPYLSEAGVSAAGEGVGEIGVGGWGWLLGGP